MISREKKFIFIHIPKTGGNAIQLALGDYSDDEIVFNERQQAYNQASESIQRFGIRNPYINIEKHSRIDDIHTLWDAESLGPWPGYFKFACVRNPWDRMVSFYFSPNRGTTEFSSKKFRDFIQKKADKAQATYITEDGRLAVDRLMRFEHIEVDFHSVCETIGIEAQLPHINKSRRRPYQEYYDTKSRNLVQKLFKRDIDLFEYEFEPSACCRLPQDSYLQG